MKTPIRKFGTFYLDREKDMIADLFMEGGELYYTLSTPNHRTGNLILNLAALCGLSLAKNEKDLFVIEGQVPCYINGENETVYVFRLGNTKVANIYPDGRIEQKAQIPSIAKTLMSQTKDYRLGPFETLVKTYIRREVKFCTDLHTHMNAILAPDVLIALGIVHEIRYPLYYIKKLGLKITPAQEALLAERRKASEQRFADCGLTGKYMTRRIDDHTYLNFADLILDDAENAEENIAKIRSSLAVLKDGQAVFTNLEKVYLYRYVFTKGETFVPKSGRIKSRLRSVPDHDIRAYAAAMLEDRKHPVYKNNTLFQDKLLWIAREYAKQGVAYAEISDTTLVKRTEAAGRLAQMHAVLPAVEAETGVTLRFLAAIRRVPLTIVRDNVASDYFRENLVVLSAVAGDPYVAGADIIGEEINDIREIAPVIRGITQIAARTPSFTVRIHAGENDSLRDNVANAIECVRESLEDGQAMPPLRIGHGLYTANLKSEKGKALIRDLKESGAVLEFQITSNVRLNNLSAMGQHPLRAYLAGGIPCVQGTDGGALYGTNSIDEQLALERMLHLSYGEMLEMHRSEEKVRRDALAGFRKKKKAFAGMIGEKEVAFFYEEKIGNSLTSYRPMHTEEMKMPAAQCLADRIGEYPPEGIPVVIAGGSFNNDRHRTAVRADEKVWIDALLANADPERFYFVIGHRLTGYERYLLEKNEGRFRIYAMVPSMLTEKEAKKLRKSGVRIRVSIEPVSMGVYKSVVYEVFKRRPSALFAFDGNSAGANLIQEARNAKYRCKIYVSEHSRFLRSKAAALEGYVTMLGDGDPESCVAQIEEALAREKK